MKGRKPGLGLDSRSGQGTHGRGQRGSRGGLGVLPPHIHHAPPVLIRTWRDTSTQTWDRPHPTPQR